MKYMAVCVAVMLCLASPVLAQGKGDQTSGKKHEGSTRSGTKPPGLARQDKTPKGLEKQGKTPEGWSHGKKTGWKEGSKGSQKRSKP